MRRQRVQSARACLHYCSNLMLAVLTTADHRLTSACICAVSSSALLPMLVPERSFKRALKSSDAAIRRAAASSFLTIGTGVATGAIRANQVPATTSGTPASASVGTSGRTGMREGTVTASARRLPVATCGTAAGVSTKAKAVCPLSRLVMDSLLLRYEMAVPGAPVLSLKCSIGSVNTGDGVG